MYFSEYLHREIVKGTLGIGTYRDTLVSMGHMESCEFILIVCMQQFFTIS